MEGPYPAEPTMVLLFALWIGWMLLRDSLPNILRAVRAAVPWLALGSLAAAFVLPFFGLMR